MRNGSRNAEQARERRSAVLEQSQQQSPSDISPTQSQRAKRSHKRHVLLVPEQTFADGVKANKASHSERMQQAKHGETEQ